MMKRLLAALIPIALFLLPLCLACSPADQIVPPESFAEAKALSARLDKPLLVDFFATW